MIFIADTISWDYTTRGRLIVFGLPLVSSTMNEPFQSFGNWP